MITILGKYVNHKGRNRHFTSPEELEEERKKKEKKRYGFMIIMLWKS